MYLSTVSPTAAPPTILATRSKAATIPLNTNHPNLTTSNSFAAQHKSTENTSTTNSTSPYPAHLPGGNLNTIFGSIIGAVILLFVLYLLTRYLFLCKYSTGSTMTPKDILGLSETDAEHERRAPRIFGGSDKDTKKAKREDRASKLMSKIMHPSMMHGSAVREPVHVYEAGKDEPQAVLSQPGLEVAEGGDYGHQRQNMRKKRAKGMQGREEMRDTLPPRPKRESWCLLCRQCPCHYGGNEKEVAIYDEKETVPQCNHCGENMQWIEVEEDSESDEEEHRRRKNRMPRCTREEREWHNKVHEAVIKRTARKVNSTLQRIRDV
jgi:hypothetical protein